VGLVNTASALNDPAVRADLRLGGTRCVAWRDQPLPARCSPPTARVGVEQRSDATAVLLVDRGVSYDGPHAQLRDWFADGALEFDSIDDLIAWTDHWLGSAADPTPDGSGGRTARGGRAGRLTDLDAVVTPDAGATPLIIIDAGKLHQLLAEEVVGQTRALGAMSRRVREHLAQQHPRRPLSLFAVGPTGVGKTAAAQRLSDALTELTGTRWGFLRLDMNEYREHHRVSQLLGAPAGYVGHRDTTPLVDTLTRDPAAVILFDEIDKAHPDVMVTLMAALDAGRLTTGDGNTIDLRRAVVIFTSNRHAEAICRRIAAEADDAVVDSTCRRELLEAGIWPELVGRVRAHLLFEPLDSAANAEIAVLAIDRAADSYGLRVTSVDPRVVSALLGHSTDLGLGVRRYEHDATALLGDAFVEYLGLDHHTNDITIGWNAGTATVHSATSDPTTAGGSL